MECRESQIKDEMKNEDQMNMEIDQMIANRARIEIDIDNVLSGVFAGASYRANYRAFSPVMFDNSLQNIPINIPGDISYEEIIAGDLFNFWICDECKSLINFEDEPPADIDPDLCDRLLCESCYEDLYKECSDCGDICPENKLVYLENGDRWICRDCRRSNYVRCNDCNELIHEDNAISDNNGTVLCESCFENDYTRCDSCGSIVQQDEIHYSDHRDEYLCESCYDESGGDREFDIDRLMQHDRKKRQSEIKHYTTVSSQMERTFGLEIEMDNGNLTDEFLDKLDELNKTEAFRGIFLYKQDGSLSDESGIEVVFDPVSPQFACLSSVFPQFARLSSSNGFKSDECHGCGLHVHFGKNYTSRDQKDLMVRLIQKFKSDLWKFARRPFNTYCNGYDDIIRESTKEDELTGKMVKITYNDLTINNYTISGDRYRAINFTNEHTDELRFFKGSLNVTTIRATIQFCDLFVDVVKAYDDIYDEIDLFETMKYLANQKNYREFAKYCEIRGL